MGSRGMALKTGGFVEYKYHTVMRDGRVRFIVRNDNLPVKFPEMSNSKSVVYVTLGRSGRIKSISLFNCHKKKYKEIDIDHRHEGMQPHVHLCDPKTSTRYPASGVRSPTARERHLVQKIIRFYAKNGLKEIAIKAYKEVEK